jgi:hypothetical protein
MALTGAGLATLAGLALRLRRRIAG